MKDLEYTISTRLCKGGKKDLQTVCGSFVNMELDISWEEKSVSAEEQLELNKLLRAGIYETLTLGGGSEDAEIGVVLVDDETIHLLNQTYRGVDRPTDVLSFSMLEKGEGEPDINMDDLCDVELDEQESENINPQDDEEVLRRYEDSLLGDIVISVERARIQAAEFGHSLAREIVYLAVHGTSHLLGFDHYDDKNRIVMRRLEEQVMEKIGLPR